MTAGQARAFGNLWPRYGLDFAPRLLDPVELFGRATDRVLEIGFGNGESLVLQAAANPGLDYLGIEVHRPGIGHCLLEADSRHVQNLRLICHDAIDVLSQQIPDRFFCRVNLYFPDPWPKKRHHKRRLLQQPFLELLAQKICAGGGFHIATDWSPYAEHIDAVVAESPHFAVGERREHSGDRPIDRPTTRFERRGLAQGHRIWEWRLTRVA